MISIHGLLVREPLRDLSQRPRGNVTALDVLRSFAVVSVIVSHFSTAHVQGGGVVNWFSRLPVVSGGRVGVDLFFVLSGYLIGGQLWRELAARGTVDMSRFMLRRTFRIWPLYFFFFAIVKLVLRPGQPDWRGWSDVVFLTNYVNQGVVMGSWSLCTEEQFYIVAPLLVLVGSNLRHPVRHYGKILLGLLVLLPVVRALTWWRMTGDFHHHNADVFARYLYQPFHTHADGLVVGLLIARYWSVFGERARAGALAAGAVVLASVAIFVAGHLLHREVFDFLGISLVFGSVVHYCLSRRPTGLAFLELPGFYVISRLSYGMYLNHEYMQHGVAYFTLHRLPLLGRIPAAQEMAGAGLLLVLSAALSLVTYCLVEHPFLQMRDVMLSRSKGEHSTA